MSEAEAAAAQEEVEAQDDEDDMMDTMNLISKEGKQFEVLKRNAMISVLVAVAVGNEPNTVDFPVSGVRSEILDIVIEYMNHHEGTEPSIIEKPLKSTRMKDVCEEPWDAAWIDKIADSRQCLYELILAANVMDIKGLLHLTCAKVASMIKGQPTENLKDILAVT